MSRKLILLDIDGTLTNSKKEITPKTKEALFKAMDAGHIVMIASGRPTPGLRRYEEELELKKRGGYLMSYNGAKVTRCSDSKVVYQKKMPVETVSGLYDYAEAHELGIMTYDSADVICGRAIDQYVQLEADLNKMRIRTIDNFKEYVTFDVNKCIITSNPDISLQYVEELRELYGDILNIGRSEPFFIEIMSKGVDKAMTLENILDIVGVSHEDTIACGDGFNDTTMIKYAALGVAMANAQPEVKAAADYITDSNDEDGIAKVIYEFVLK